MNKSGEE